MSSRWLVPMLCLLAMPTAAFAQDSNPPSSDDDFANAEVDFGPPAPMEDCTEEQEAASIAGEIVVCRRRVDDSEHRYSTSTEAADRYARETMNKGDPPPPNVDGEYIFTGPATVGGLCLVPPCPPPAAYIIDFDELPETPPGSDADRVGQGLAPRGNDAGTEPTPAPEG